MITIVGTGGTGCFLAVTLGGMVDEIQLIDPDIVEEKNLGRQYFNKGDIGKPKVEALKDKIFCDVTAMQGEFEKTPKFGNFIFCSADQHYVRKQVLEHCDEFDVNAIICGNEEFEFDAYLYKPEYKGTKADPRVRFKEIANAIRPSEEDKGPSCTDVTANVQNISANMLSASMGVWLYQAHTNNDSEETAHLPVYVYGSKTRTFSEKEGDLV